jgi:hypothetical protein
MMSLMRVSAQETTFSEAVMGMISYTLKLTTNSLVMLAMTN